MKLPPNCKLKQTQDTMKAKEKELEFTEMLHKASCWEEKEGRFSLFSLSVYTLYIGLSLLQVVDKTLNLWDK